MKTRRGYRTFRFLAAFVCLLVQSPLVAAAGLSEEAALDKAYGAMEPKLQCRVVESDGARYCMKVIRADRIAADTGDRLYVLAAGNVTGEGNADHISLGLVGAFVLEAHDGVTETVAADPRIAIGAFGMAPTEWTLVKLAAGDYRGWMTTTGDCHQGYCGSRYVILAPYGKRIRDLAGFASGYSDTGAEESAGKSSEIDSSLEIATMPSTDKVYPLKVTVTGTDRGKPLASQSWMLHFDTKTWKYKEPGSWPLGNRDF